jgi:intein-encoded DNA endonuclease-like protein
MVTDDYIAGFFDGEGSILFKKHNDKRGCSYIEINVFITSCNKEVLEEIQNYLKCGSITETGNHKQGYKHCYRLYIYKQSEMLSVLKQLLPCLIVKKEEAVKAIEFIEGKKKGRGLHAVPPRSQR